MVHILSLLNSSVDCAKIYEKSVVIDYIVRSSKLMTGLKGSDLSVSYRGDAEKS